MLKKLLKIFLWIVSVLIGLIVGLIVYVRIVSVTHPPEPKDLSSLERERVVAGDGAYTLGSNWFRKSKSGLYEMYVEGEPFERGVANGKLSRELVQHQEEVFNGQIHQLVPSDFYLSFLTYFVGWFNRDLEDFVQDEYKLEIYGVSQSASHDFDNIASPYQRILNYHGAHDIGHALQNMALVGCTSFGVWGDKSVDSTLTIGRNFDFFVGDQFAEDKIVAFYNPSSGHKFMMVTWGGMTGVLSGMNMEGLTVTINAAKSDIPTSAATPVSLVAREILQYASTIDEAYAIAAKRKMFVAESFLVGSAKDNRAAIIEKTPDGIDMYDPNGNAIICTNHFQGPTLGASELNQEHIKTSASAYRYDRVKELLGGYEKVGVAETAAILRNQLGSKNCSLGLGNERAVNQLVAHHAIIFQPERRLVWVSTAPWQLGKFVCYNLNDVFARPFQGQVEITDSTRTIGIDPFLATKEYSNYVKFARYRFPFEPRTDMDPDSIVVWNPDSYHAYMLAGDAEMERGNYRKAIQEYTAGLSKVVATEPERIHMENNLKKCKEKL